MVSSKERSEQELMDHIGKLGKQWGLGEPAGRVFASLILAESPITQREIARRTKYSLSLVSPSLKILERLNLIRVVRREDREKYYEPISSFTESFGKVLHMFIENEVHPIVDLLENIHKNPKRDKLVQEYKLLENNLRHFEAVCVHGRDASLNGG